MKVLYLHQYFVAPDMSGGSRSYMLAKHLVDNGHEVTLVTTYRGAEADYEPRSSIDGIDIIWTFVPYSNAMSFTSRLFAFFKYAIASTLIGFRVKSDVVFATSTPLTVAIPGCILSWCKRVPMVFEVRDLWPDVPIALSMLQNPFLQWVAAILERVAYRSSKYIVALSPGIESGIVAKGVEPGKITVIPNMSDSSAFGKSDQNLFWNQHPSLPRKKIVLYAGTFGYVNDVAYLVKLAQEVSQVSDEIVIVAMGDGAEKESIAKMAEDVGVMGANFFVFDSVPKNQVVHVYAAAWLSISVVRDVEILEHNSANKYFDGLAAGKPMLVNHGGWQAVQIEAENCGVQLKRDAHLAAQQLVTLSQDENLTTVMGRNAKNLAERIYERDILSKQFEQVLVRASQTK